MQMEKLGVVSEHFTSSGALEKLFYGDCMFFLISCTIVYKLLVDYSAELIKYFCQVSLNEGMKFFVNSVQGLATNSKTSSIAPLGS